MKTYIFHYPNWERQPNGHQIKKMIEYRTKALTRAEAEALFWNKQIASKTFTKYTKAEVIENRKRIPL